VPNTPEQERSTIVRNLEKRPYGTKVRFQVKTETAFGNFEQVTLLLNSGQYASVVPDVRKAPWEGGARFVLTLNGFATAIAAEIAGKRMVQSLLWTAVKLRTPIRLEYGTYEAATVYERNRSSGIECIAFGVASPNANSVLETIAAAFEYFKEPNPTLALSMEIFCSAGLEASQRATLLLYVSALEPLATVSSLGPTVNVFIEQCSNLLDQSQDIDVAVKRSLRGRLGQLGVESIRQAIRRVVRDVIPDDTEALSVVDRAYTLRSELVHSGRPSDSDVDLAAEAEAICAVLRKIYERMLFEVDG
jgi:hypothetical protein